MKYKAIIFDMDGTIIDTEHLWRGATLKVLQNRAIEITPEIEQTLRKELTGLALQESCQFVKDFVGIEDPTEHLIQEKFQHVLDMYHEVTYMPGFEDFYKKIKTLNLPTAIATNASQAGLEKTDEQLGLAQHFGEHMYSIARVNNVCKPDPAIFLFTAERLNVRPEECIVIEDSAHGVTAAKAAGMTCIGLEPKAKEFTNHADFQVSHYSEIDIETILKA